MKDKKVSSTFQGKKNNKQLLKKKQLTEDTE